MKGADIGPSSPSGETPRVSPVLLTVNTPENETQGGDSNIVTPKVVIRPLSEHMDGTDEPKAWIQRRDKLTTDGPKTPPKLSEPRSNPHPSRRNRQTKSAAKSDPKPSNSIPPEAEDDEEEISPNWESRMVDEPANESAWYTNFAEWDSPEEEAVVNSAEETKGSDADDGGLELENRQQSNEAFSGSTSNHQKQYEEQVPASEAEERESPSRNYEDKSQGQSWASEGIEWDNDDAGAAQDRSFDTNASPSDVSQFDLATQSSQQGRKDTIEQSDELSSLPPTACEF